MSVNRPELKIPILANMKFSSKLLENTVQAFSRLPGIGKKTALRLVLHIIQKDPSLSDEIQKTLFEMKQGLKRCKSCFNLSDYELCNICLDPVRKKDLVCVVESVRDVMAIEHTEQFSGMYHVLGGVISPIDGIGPSDLYIEELIDRVKNEHVSELIMAVNPTIEGETTIFYISKRLKDLDVKVSLIARGVSFGGELEYTDGITLGRSILQRTEYQLHNED